MQTPSVCDISGMEIAYYAEGAGKTVLLVHGIPTYSFIWRKIIPLLSDRYRVVCLDLPGCGRSGKQIDRPYSLKSHAGLIRRFVDALDIHRFHFVGHDVGGGIGQIFAVRYPDRLHDLTLVNTVAYDYWPVQPIIAMRTPVIRHLAMATLDIGALRLIVRRGLFHKERLTRELIALFWAPMTSREGRRAFLHFASSLDNRDLTEITPALHRLDLPVLIIRSDGDVYLSGAISQRLAEDLPDSRRVVIATGGHFIQEDEPDLLVREIHQFLSRTTI